MKLTAILVLWLAFVVHQTRAEPSIFDIISGGARAAGSIAEGAAGAIGGLAGGVVDKANDFAKGVIDTATGISKGAVGVKTGVVSNLADVAASFSQAIANTKNEVESKALQAVLRQVQATLVQIQDASTKLMQESEIAGQKIQRGVIELEAKQEESINAWADKAKNRLADASEDAQISGQDLIDGFANERTEDLRECTDNIVSQLEQLQEKANATAKEFEEPMSKLLQQVGKCAQLKANDFRGLSGCAADTRKVLQPLQAAPGQLTAVQAQIVSVGLQSLPQSLCVAATLTKFNLEAMRVDMEIDQLIAEDKKNAEEQPATDASDEADPADEEQQKSDDGEDTAPADGKKPAPADGKKPAPAEGKKPAPADGKKPAPDDGKKPAPAEGKKPAPDDGKKPAPAHGKKPAPADGKKPAPAEGKKPAPADGKKPAPADGKKPAPDDGKKPAPAEGKKPAPADGKKPAPADKQQNGEKETNKASGGDRNTCHTGA